MKDLLKEIERILDLLYEHIDDYTPMSVDEIKAIHDDLTDVYNNLELMSIHQKEQEGMSAEALIERRYSKRFSDKWDRVAKLFDYYDMIEFAEQYAASRIAEEWVSVKDNPPTEIAGCEIVCLKNGAVMEMNYSNFSSRLRWWRMGIGDEHPENPVIYRMPLPKPPKTK